MKTRVRYGRGGLEVELPDRNVAAVLRLNPVPPIEAPKRAVADALRWPISSPALLNLARGRQSACVVISDITRPVPNKDILAPLLRALEEAGLSRGDVTILIGTGLHRPNEGDELLEMLGRELLDDYRVVNHLGRDVESHADLGRTRPRPELGLRGTPVQLDRRYVEADLKVAVSLIEPHLMAGYSGGRKAICPGIASVNTIRVFHGPQLMEPEESRAGLLDGNPCHEESLAIAGKCPPDFIVNVTLDERRRITGIFAGHWIEAWLAGAAHCERAARATLPEPVDVVVTTNAGYPLDLTFYQAVKGIIQATPIVKRGGTVIIAAECAEGVGGPEFTELILGVEDLEAFVRRTYEPDFFAIDQWQMHMLARARRKVDVYCLADGIPREVLDRLFVSPIESVEHGVELALRKHGRDAMIAVIPEGPYVLPEVDGSRNNAGA
ncbi:MAG: nickel-dependent lactate racemase [Armatimonadota bacterium]